VAFYAYLKLRRRFGDPIDTPLRWAAVAAAVAGAALGSKILFWLEDPRQTLENLHNPAYLIGGKTIVGALIGGLVAVELIKRYIGLRTSTGDLYAIPLAVGIAIGRIGCFLTGLSDNTYGTPTGLPWGINFGDGIRRHPTQLYEIAFLIALIPILYLTLRKIVIPSAASAMRSVADPQAKACPERSRRDPYSGHATPGGEVPLTPDARRQAPAFLPGDAFKLFMVAYLTLRLLDDFIKPYPRLFLGLGGIQWSCLLTLLYYSRDIARWLRPRFV